MNNILVKKHISQVVIVFVIASLSIIPASATMMYSTEPASYGGVTIYVDDDNTDGPWDGTMDYPYQFIQDGIDHASDGDTVYVFHGYYRENIVVSKSIELLGEDRCASIVGYSYSGTIVQIVADNVTISGFSISDCGSAPNNAGVMVHTSNNVITNNNFRNNDNYGLYVNGANNQIYHNNFMKNAYQAVDITASSSWDAGYPEGGNYWDDYNGTDNDEDGIGEIPYPTGNCSQDSYPLIHPYGSIYNTDNEEIFLTIQKAIDDDDTQDGHGISVSHGIYLEHLLISKSILLWGGGHSSETIIDGRFSGDVITICADDVSIEGFMIRHSGTMEQNAGIVVQGNTCSLLYNIINKNFHGIMLKQNMQDTTIANNQITDNGWNGIVLKPGCINSNIIENTIANNFYAGLGISDASNNCIYHNTFQSNRHHAYDTGNNIWDDGYPSGGNYWDDYTGSDEDGDGLGDTPYAIPDGINTDRYPLMAPYTSEDTIPPVVTIVSPTNGLYIGNLRFMPWLFRQGILLFGPVTIDVEASDAHSGIARVEFLIDDANEPLFTDTQEPYSWRWTKASLLFHKHTIIVIAYDNAGNPNFDMLEVRRYL